MGFVERETPSAHRHAGCSRFHASRTFSPQHAQGRKFDNRWRTSVDPTEDVVRRPGGRGTFRGDRAPHGRRCGAERRARSVRFARLCDSVEGRKRRHRMVEAGIIKRTARVFMGASFHRFCQTVSIRVGCVSGESASALLRHRTSFPASRLFPEMSRSAFSHSRIPPGSTRRTKSSRSAAADIPQILRVLGALFERWGNCRTADPGP